MTGGALGSLIAQCVKVTSAERKTLLVAGAAAGMTAVFGTPVAAVLLAVELLLFEWRPRSFLPVALACAVAGFARAAFFGAGPLFPLETAAPDALSLVSCVIAGLLSGALASGLSAALYKTEDLFGKLPIHWMWWPAIGGIGIGIGGYFFPRGLGVGYDNIAELLRGNAPVALLLGLVIAKSLMWAFSLSSGTSGGVLAPLLMIGAAIGESAAHLAHLPAQTQALWALMGMGAMLSGALGVPLTAILFSLELTHALPAILPLVLACTASYLVTSLIMPRSILTEKLGRRGYHLSREYGVDPLELLIVGEVMSELPPGDEVMVGGQDQLPENYVFSDETCRAVAEEMATTGLMSLLVVDRATNRLMGTVGAAELLAGRRRAVMRESDRSVAFQFDFPRS
jgi:H+/Cl- antiporter ClcA